MRRPSPAALAALALLAFLPASPAAAQPGKATALPAPYRTWLEETVAYIIAPREREVFLALRTDRERDVFIEAFWKQRDPTAGTPRNEYREEHERRVKRANEVYGRGTPRPGWKTDRGRISILLGEPRTVEDFDAVNGVHPVEIWGYLGDESLGLPAAFNVIFYKRQGSGEYVLYSPTQDGPDALIADSMKSYENDEQAWRALQTLEPNLARQVLSLIPGERAYPGLESLASTKLMASISEAPRRKVRVDYADALLRYRDRIEVEYSANYVPSEAEVRLVRDPSGALYLHYTIEPGKISVEPDGAGGYDARFQVDGRVSDAAGRTVYQFDKDVPLKLTAAELEEMRATSLSLQDMVPIVPGRYTVDLLLKNALSREFTGAGRPVVVPAPGAGPSLAPLVLAYGAERRDAPPGERVPFRAAGRQLLCQGRKTFGAKDRLTLLVQAYNLTPELRSGGSLRLALLKDDREVLGRDLPLGADAEGPGLVETQPLEGFAPGYYQARVALRDAQGREVDLQKESFEISYAPAVPRPIVVSKVASAGAAADYAFATGVQDLNLGRLEESKARLAEALAADPARADVAAVYARVLFRLNDFAGAKATLAPLAAAAEPAADVLALMGQACHALGDYAGALRWYASYLSRYGANVDILNFSGTCHFQLGEREEAIRAWTKSLELSPDQPKIRELLERVKR